MFANKHQSESTYKADGNVNIFAGIAQIKFFASMNVFQAFQGKTVVID